MTTPRGAAEQAATSQQSLMGAFSAAGLPILQRSLAYSQNALNQMNTTGLPAYVKAAYPGASTAALEQASAEGNSARRTLLRGPTDALAVKAPAFEGAGANFARENASIGLSKGLATISQRNQLLNNLTGAGSTSTNLSGAFGALTNRALTAGLSAGNPTYEGVVGGVAGVTPLLLTALTRQQSSSPLNSWNPTGAYSPGFSQQPSDSYT